MNNFKTKVDKSRPRPRLSVDWSQGDTDEDHVTSFYVSKNVR